MTRSGHRSRVPLRGQALVEFALVLPVLLVLLFGILDFGRAIYAYNTVANAAREGARVAAVNQIQESSECVQDRPIQNLGDPHWSIKACAIAAGVALGIQTADVTVSYRTPPGTALACATPLHVGCIASVTVVHTFRPLTPIIGDVVGSIPLSSTSQVPIERVFP